MFQIKGQGTVTPDVRSLFNTENPDIVRFISFPLSIHGEVIPNLFVGAGIQPSLYLSGSDNYRAKDIWHGWVWGTVISIKYWKEWFEVGAEFDYDFNLYYCPDCDIRFNTYRIYASYHFLKDQQ
jgi:hypothetical protein